MFIVPSILPQERGLNSFLFRGVGSLLPKYLHIQYYYLRVSYEAGSLLVHIVVLTYFGKQKRKKGEPPSVCILCQIQMVARKPGLQNIVLVTAKS